MVFGPTKSITQYYGPILPSSELRGGAKRAHFSPGGFSFPFPCRLVQNRANCIGRVWVVRIRASDESGCPERPTVQCSSSSFVHTLWHINETRIIPVRSDTETNKCASVFVSSSLSNTMLCLSLLPGDGRTVTRRESCVPKPKCGQATRLSYKHHLYGVDFAMCWQIDWQLKRNQHTRKSDEATSTRHIAGHPLASVVKPEPFQFAVN